MIKRLFCSGNDSKVNINIEFSQLREFCPSAGTKDVKLWLKTPISELFLYFNMSGNVGNKNVNKISCRVSVKNSKSSQIEIRKVFQKAVKLFFWEKCEALKAALASLASMPSMGNHDGLLVSLFGSFPAWRRRNNFPPTFQKGKSSTFEEWRSCSGS